jgi:anaerobic magnesium-protoporphyrin IX monomethyl ester cyclase
MSKLDILFVEPNSSQEAYQELSHTFSAIETPTWSLLLAQSCRAKGYSVAILDCVAERLTAGESAMRIKDLNPRLVCFVVYGQNPNSGTVNMSGAYKVASLLRENFPHLKIGFVGSHTSALPREVLSQPFVDFVFIGDGVYAIQNLLKSNLTDYLDKVNGVGWKSYDGTIQLNKPEIVVPHDRMDIDLPGYAWDLLPYRNKPLDLYRSHFWHSEFNYEKRTPFASIYTSFGCQFKCDFCMISQINRQTFDEDYSGEKRNFMRYWSGDVILKEFEKLAKMGVKTLRISDEMFFLNKKHFEPIIQGLVERDYGFNMWAYSRVDTVQPKFLESFKKAGINWLALGVEAANQEIRYEISKGTFKNINIKDVTKTVHDAGLNIISNYIFGFPDDTIDTMQQTLDLALELNTETVNMYPCQALPGSALYLQAKKNGWELPKTPEGFAFLSYESLPLPTKHLTSAQVLAFRDKAWATYFTSPKYLELVEQKFGLNQRKNVEDMAKVKLKRKLLGD